MLRKYFLNAIRSFIIASRLIKIDFFFFCNYRTSPRRTFFEREMANIIIIIIIINIEIALSSSLTGTSIDS